MSYNIKFNDFKNICRTCMFNNDLKPIQDNVILTVLQNITDINYTNNNELPQQICTICIKKIHDIHVFILQCKSTNLTLNECLINYKNDPIQIKVEPSSESECLINNKNLKIDETTQHIKDEITIEDSFEFIKIETTTITDETKKIDDNTTLNYENKERPFKCETCSKTYTRSSHLKAHKRIHSDERPFKCDCCAKTFSRSDHLTAHKRIHTDERPYKCDVCAKTFTHSSSFKKHEIIHTNERPYKCTVCEKTFNRSGNLNAHKRVHTDERPFKCHVCTKTFTHSANLIAHKRIHVPKKK